jgi:HD-GYP domain-containing protein (c-di-GMP phosphodiesterase class II)
MSFGVAIYPYDGTKIQQIVAYADARLYESKLGALNETDAPEMETNTALTSSFGILDSLVTAVDRKDHYTRSHSEEMTEYALAIAGALGLSEDSQRTLRIAGLLHDVGKIGVPDRILRKPAKLEEEEYLTVQNHVTLAEMMIREVPNVTDVLAAVSTHHEKFDGTGYPRGLRGDDIPLLGRILAVADSYSAMTSDRPYRAAMSHESARAELLHAAGSQLDPDVVDAFLRIIDYPLRSKQTNAPDQNHQANGEATVFDHISHQARPHRLRGKVKAV